MKKLLAILTVMCMVLTTMIVPTLVFGNEGADDEETAVIGFDPWYNGENDMTFEGKCYEVSFDGGYNTGVSLSSKIGDAYSIIIEPTSSSEDESFLGWRQHAVVEVDDGEGGSYFDFGDQVSPDIYSTEDVLAMDVPAEGVIFVGVWDGVDSGIEPDPEPEGPTVIVGFEPNYDGDYEMTFEGQCHGESFDWGYYTDVPLSGKISDVYNIVTDPSSSSVKEEFLGWKKHMVVEVKDDEGEYFDAGDPFDDTIYTSAQVLAMTPPEEGAVFVGVWEGIEYGSDEDNGIGFNIWLNANEGFITYTYIDENGVKQTLDTSQIMPGMLETDEDDNYISFKESLTNQGQEILEINKPNYMFKGWKIYSWTSCEIVQDVDDDGIEDDYEAGDNETSVYIGEWSFDTEEQYDTYLFMDYDPEAYGICSLEDLLDLELSDEINGYYAEAQWEQCKVVSQELDEEEVQKVPETIKNAAEKVEQDLVDYIKNELKAAVSNDLVIPETNTEKAGIIYKEVELQIKDEQTGNWVEVTDENFPEEGIQILLEYPEEAEADWAAYDYVVTHMITSEHHPLVEDGKHDVGDVEVLDAKATEDGIVATVYSLSPIAIAYQEAPDDSQDGEGTTPGGTTDPNQPGNTDNNTPGTTGATSGTTATPDKAVDTGDNFNMAPYIAVMMIALAGVAVAMLRRRAE